MKLRSEPDPKLVALAAEIHALYRKHDLCGIAIIASPDATEYTIEIEPSWTCCRIEGNLLRIRTKGLNLTPEQKRKLLENTAGTILGFVTAMKAVNEQFETILTVLGQHLEIAHIDKRLR